MPDIPEQISALGQNLEAQRPLSKKRCAGFAYTRDSLAVVNQLPLRRCSVILVKQSYQPPVLRV
ncbi:MAG: hypothetical protein U5K34_03090 [Thiohalophilus sp.]|nr:hypothetical protein [Thiohalophilus sp.]